MSFIGKLLAAPIRLVNLPARLIEDLVEDGTPFDGDRLLSSPLDTLADGIEKGVDYVTKGKK